MKKIIIILSLIFSPLFALDSASILQPTEEYLELTNDKYFPDTIKEFWAADSNGAYSPTKAFWFSIACPGLGQLYNRKPLKAAFYFSAEVYHIYFSLYYNSLYKNDVKPNVRELKTKIGTTAWYAMSASARTEMLRDSTSFDLDMNYWRPKDKRNKRIWWCAGIYIISMLDAYVDAHLSDFPTGDMEFINDTANRSQGVRLYFDLQRGKK